MLRAKLIVALFSAGTLLAGQDFEVSPVLMSFNANPGEIQTKTINLINHSSKPQKYTFKLSDYEVDSDGVKKPVPSGTGKRSLSDWLTINPSFVELNPNQSVTAEVLLTVPKDGFSTRWGMIYVEVSKEQTGFDADKSMATGVVVVPRIIILVKQTPQSNNNYRAMVQNLKEVTEPGDAFKTFEVQVVNTGDNIIDARVSLALANIETASEEKFDPVQVTVYPGGTRTVKLQLRKQIPRGSYALAAIMDYGHRQPLEGTQLLLDIK
ncbi:MAG: DUF916 domain-containing protein [Bacteroidales bacterium]|jgi:hypothetical protein|nr:DUF916 domain-containing protein [Bacteroidales bacterium]MCU0407676.1 DUF916 domain-containing protein [Bacteroidales bacterium]